MNRRRNETRLLDLNRTLQNKNAELEKRVETLRREYATDCVSSDAIGMCDRVMERVVFIHRSGCPCFDRD